MFSFFLHISEGKLGLICFDLLRELCSCHRHRLPLCPFSHQSISVDTVFPRNTEIPLLATACSAEVVHSGKSSSDLKGVGGWGGEVFSTSRIFLVCLPPSSNQETGWLFKKIVNRAEHPVFGHKIHRRYKKSRVLKHKPTTFFFELYSPFLHN